MSGGELIQKVRNGETKAVLAWLYQYQDAFIHFALKMNFCSEEEARDTFHYALVAFVENIISGKLTELKCTAKTYLFTIGKYKLNSIYQKKKKQAVLSENNHPAYEADGDRTEEEQEESVKVKKIAQALELLGEKGKQLMTLYFFERFSIEQITKAMGYKNKQTTSNAKNKFMKRLKILLEEVRIHDH